MKLCFVFYDGFYGAPKSAAASATTQAASILKWRLAWSASSPICVRMTAECQKMRSRQDGTFIAS